MLKMIGYLSTPNHLIDIDFVKSNLKLYGECNEVIGGCVSEYGSLTQADNIENKLYFYIMQCYFYLLHKYEYKYQMNLRFWLEKDKWDWRIKCDYCQ